MLRLGISSLIKQKRWLQPPTMSMKVSIITIQSLNDKGMLDRLHKLSIDSREELGVTTLIDIPCKSILDTSMEIALIRLGENADDIKDVRTAIDNLFTNTRES